MGFPVTINGNTYNESDFSPYGYVTAFPAILSDLATVASNIAAAAAAGAIMVSPLQAVSGSVGAPGITFGGDTDSGLYRIGANNIGLALNGAKVVDYATTGLGVTGDLTWSGAAWTAFSPTLSYVAGSDTAVVTFARYKLFGKLCVAAYEITTTTKNTASAYRLTLPVNSLGTNQGPAGCGNNYVTGKALVCYGGVDDHASFRVYRYDGASPVDNNGDVLLMTMVYEIA